MSTQPLLVAHNLHKRFGSVHAVRGITFAIAEGEIYSLLGPTARAKPPPSAC